MAMAVRSSVGSSIGAPLISGFSTSTSNCSNLVRKLDEEIERYTKGNVAWVPRVPPEFPFEIKSSQWANALVLSRRYEDELIIVEAYLEEDEEDEEDDDEEEEKEEEEEDDDDDDEEEEEEDSMTMTITITKKSNNSTLLFEISAYEDRITIDNLHVEKGPWGTKSSTPLPFQELNEELKEGFIKYLEIRGIHLTNINLLRLKMCDEAMKRMEHREWLCDLKNFLA